MIATDTLLALDPLTTPLTETEHKMIQFYISALVAKFPALLP